MRCISMIMPPGGVFTKTNITLYLNISQQTVREAYVLIIYNARSCILCCYRNADNIS